MMPKPPLSAVQSALITLMSAAFRPAQARTPWRVIGLTSAGCALAVLLVGAVLAASGMAIPTAMALIAPFGASALLVVAVPNSPLSQPRAVLLGNCAAALIGVAVAGAVPAPVPAAALALALALGAMLALRALHPPAGAIAVLPALSPATVGEAGLGFALAPVGVESLLLLSFALVWHRWTGRVYPLRPPEAVPRAAARFSRADLAAILARLRLSQNIGVADFARLLAAADGISSAHDRTEGLRCADAAGAPPPFLAPDTPLAAARDLMLGLRAYALPVVAPDGRLLGILSQSDLLRANGAGQVAQVMTPDPAHLRAEAPLHAALSLLAQGGWRSVPLTDADGRCTGMLTRADLIAVLARAPGDAPLPQGPARGNAAP